MLFDWSVLLCFCVLSFRRILVQGEVAVGAAAAGLAFLTKVRDGRIIFSTVFPLTFFFWLHVSLCRR